MENRKINFTVAGEPVAIEVDYDWRTGTHTTVYLDRVDGYRELAISGEVLGSVGQCVEHVHELAEKVQNDNLNRLCEIWKRWHLNSLNGGTRVQADKIAENGSYVPHEAAKKILRENGLLVDRGYTFGSAWLVEVIPQSVFDELEVILDELDGKTIGTVDLSEAPEIDSDQDVIDTRDVVHAHSIYKTWAEENGVRLDSEDDDDLVDKDDEFIDNVEVARRLHAIIEQGSDEWRFGETLIADSYFVEYAKEFAQDAYGEEIDSAKWPFSHIDWEAAGETLKIDYDEVEIDGKKFWVR